jgi:hypothetical protein
MYMILRQVVDSETFRIQRRVVLFCSFRFWLRLKEMLPGAGLGSPRLFSVLEPIEQLAGSFSGR